MLQGQRFLNTARLAMIVMTLAAKLDLARPLRFLRRVQSVDAFDDEIVGRFTGKVYAADIIADDQVGMRLIPLPLSTFSEDIR